MNAASHRGSGKTAGHWLPITIVTVVAAVLIALFVWWWLHTHERVTKTIDLPPKGEAAYNPLYALKLSLQAAGQTVSSRQRLRLDQHPLTARDTVLLLGDPRTLSASEREGLLAWVEQGGHLIVRTPPYSWIEETGNGQAALLTDLGVEVSDRDPSCFGLSVPGEKDHVEFCHGRRFSYYDEDAVAWDDEATGETGFARVRYGNGSADVLADLDFLENGKLQDRPHVALTRQLLQPNWDARGTFHLIYSANMPSLWKLLWQHGWMILVSALLALLMWLWMRSARFGPLLPSAASDRRSLLEHIQASGDHLYRYGRTGTLYAAVHEAFVRQLRRRDPYAAALEGPAQIDAIARRTGMRPAEVEDALRYPRPRDPKDFVTRIAKLLSLRQRL